MKSSARTLLTSNALVTIALLAGFVSNIAIATIFGLTRRVDAFFAAQVLPNLFLVLFIDYLGKNFLPTLARAKRESQALAAELTSSIISIVALTTSVVAVALALASGPLFGLLLPGFSAADIAVVQTYFWIMAPAVPLMAITIFHQYVCQYDERYVQITAIRTALPVANLIAIVAVGPLLGETALPIGFLAGQIIVFLLMTRQARYTYSFQIKWRPNWERRIFSNSAILMGSGLVARTRNLIMNYFGSLLGEGAISALALAAKLTEPLGRSMFTAVRMLMFSRTARLAADDNSAEIARLHEVGVSSAFLLLAPLSWWIALNSHAIVEALLLRGEFDARMAGLVALALIGSAPYLIFDGVTSLLSNAFYALERIAVPALVMPLATLVFLVLVQPLSARYGVLGLTGSMSISTMAIFVILLVLLARHVPGFGALVTAGRVIRYTTIGGLAIGAPVAGLAALDWPPIAVAAASLAVGVLLYGAALLALKDSMLAALHAYLRRSVPMRSVRSPTG